MATQPAPENLPLFYKNLEPLSSSIHSNYKVRTSETAPYLAGHNAVPLTIDEFVSAQRHFPITAGHSPTMRSIGSCALSQMEGSRGIA